MKMTTLRDLYLDILRDLYDAEKQLTKALPQMVKAATSQELQGAFEEHLEQTQGQIGRLEQIFERLGEAAKGKKCKAMAGLIEEAKELIEEDPEPDVLDAGLIVAAQKVEHYEIASYGSVCTYAKLLGEEEDLELLGETLDEEKEADENLTELAETSVNVDAAESDDDEEEPSPKRGGKRAGKS